MKTNNEVVISETSRMQQMWGWWRAKLELAAQSPWYASHLLRRFYDLMKTLKPSKQLVASTVTGAALLMGSIAMNPAPAQAAGITVNSTADTAVDSDGSCTLREALTNANDATSTDQSGGDCAAGTGGGSDTIDLTGVSGTITLSSNLPAIPNAGEHIVLNGPGAASLTINGGVTFITINNGGTGNNLTVDGLTINGAGVHGVSANGNVIVTNSIITGSNGRAVNTFADATVTNSTLSGNNTLGVFASGSATVINSTISGNASVGVQATYNVSVINSTISGNANTGVYAARDDVTVINSTITGNGGKGVDVSNNNGGTAVLTLKNSLIVGNTGSDVDCTNATTFTSNSKNLIKTQAGAACPMASEITALAVASILSPLANNGGSTQTHALVAGSPAVNKGNNADSPGATDQRGQARIQSGTIDIGAFESAFADAAKAVGGVAEFITPVAHDGLMWRVVGMMGAGLAMGLGVLGLSRAKKTE